MAAEVNKEHIEKLSMGKGCCRQIGRVLEPCLAV